jgi:hypothetical protein
MVNPVPLPDNATVCGEPGALSAIAIDADLDPAADGVNLTLMVQDALAASDVPHVLL